MLFAISAVFPTNLAYILLVVVQFSIIGAAEVHVAAAVMVAVAFYCCCCCCAFRVAAVASAAEWF